MVDSRIGEFGYTVTKLREYAFEHQHGTYVQLLPSHETIYNLMNWARDSGYLQLVRPPEGHMHVTLMNTAKYVNVHSGVLKTPVVIPADRLMLTVYKKNKGGKTRDDLHLSFSDDVNIGRMQNALCEAAGITFERKTKPHITLVKGFVRRPLAKLGFNIVLDRVDSGSNNTIANFDHHGGYRRSGA